MDVRILCRDDYTVYEKFLLDFPEALFYYSVKYKDFLENLFKAKPYYLIVFFKGEIQGILPLFIKDGIYGKVVNSLPYYGSNGGIIARTKEAYSALLETYEDIISASDVIAATIVENPLKTALIPQHLYNFTDKRIGQLTPLAFETEKSYSEAILGKLDSSTRRNIRKAEKSDICVRVDNTQMAFLEKTHRKNMESIGGNAKTREFFTMFPKYFEQGKDYKIYVAFLKDKPVAAVLLFYYNLTVEYYTPVTTAEFRNLQPTAKILYQAMLDAMQNGFKFWNWGGTWLEQEGVHKFKKKWGAQDYPYTYYTKINNRKIFDLRADELLEKYPGFYVINFKELNA